MQTLVLTAHVAHPSLAPLREVLNGSFDPQGPVFASFEQAETLLACNRPTVVVVVLSPSPPHALEMLARIRNRSSAVVAVGPSQDPQLILQALHGGANHYIDEADLLRQFAVLLPRLTNTREEPAGSRSGQVISLLAASGGSGTSTLAVNLAVVLAQQAGRCALLELKPGFSDLAALLDVKPTHTLADLCVNILRLDQAMLAKALVPHPSGVHLLAPPLRYDEITLLTPQGVHKAVNMTRNAFPFVVMDQEDCFHEEQVLALRQADHILLVARLDFTSLRNTQRLLDYLYQLNIPRERVRLVINRYGQAKELPPEEVEPIIGLRIAHLVPDDPRAVNGANNAGVPVVLKSPSSKFTASLLTLADSLLPAPPPNGSKVKSRSGLRWLSTFG
jgi:pilus assembly protein CpaE